MLFAKSRKSLNLFCFVITKEEALSLIDKMTALEDPYHCAHGRPTFFTVSRKDFEKNFCCGICLSDDVACLQRESIRPE